MTQKRRHRQRNASQQLRHVGERQRHELYRTSVQGQHDRVTLGVDDTEVTAIRRVAGQSHHLCGRDVQSVLVQVTFDSIPGSRPSCACLSEVVIALKASSTAPISSDAQNRAAQMCATWKVDA